MQRLFLFSVFLFGVGVGCDDSGADAKAAEASSPDAPAKVVHACDAPSENGSNCVEWHGGTFPNADAAKAECDANRGRYAGAACRSDDVVAVCVRHKGSPMEQHEYWYGPDVTAETIEAGCKGPDVEFRRS